MNLMSSILSHMTDGLMGNGQTNAWTELNITDYIDPNVTHMDQKLNLV